MFTVKRAKIMPIISAAIFLVMLVVNMLANVLPINGVNTGGVSNSFPNLFAPTALTFAVWGVIYVTGAAFVVYEILNIKKIADNEESRLFFKVNALFAVSSVLNTIWIFLWHYYILWLSVIVILGMLVSLGIIAMLLRKNQYIFRIPFGIYFGWITIATVANFTTMLVQMGVNGLDSAAQIWAGVMIGIATLISATYVVREKDVAYGLTVLWALTGILIKHFDPAQFNVAYASVIGTVIFAMVIIIAVLGITFHVLFKDGCPIKKYLSSKNKEKAN